MIDVLRLVLLVLATYRLAMLTSYDDGPFDFIFRLREWLKSRAGNKQGYNLWNTMAAWMECPYCNGLWYAAGLTIAVMFPSTIGDFILVWLGAAGAHYAIQSILPENGA